MKYCLNILVLLLSFNCISQQRCHTNEYVEVLKNKYEPLLKRQITVPLRQQEFDSLLNIIFNKFTMNLNIVSTTLILCCIYNEF